MHSLPGWPLLLLVFLVARAVTAAPHEVTVYAYVTEAGAKFATPTAVRPRPYLLADGGYREIGSVPRGEPSPAPVRVLRWVHDALAVHHYEAIRRGSPPEAECLMVCHSGVIIPDAPMTATGRLATRLDDVQALALVGGRALRFADLPSEREAIFSAAKDERYFLIISAFADSAEGAPQHRVLLWRAQMSVPCAGLTPDEALPLLVVAGAGRCGTGTRLPCRVTVNASDELVPREELP